MRKFTGKMPNASDTTSIEHRALTLTVRTPQCGHTVWGTTTKEKADTYSEIRTYKKIWTKHATATPCLIRISGFAVLKF